MKSVTIAAVFFCLLLFLLFPRGIRVETAAALRKPVQDSYTEEGKLSLGGDYTIFSEVSGAIQEVFVSENQSVRPGTPLLTIDSENYRHQKSELENRTEGLRAQLKKLQLSQIMTASPEEYVLSLTQKAASAKAAFDAAETRFRAAEALLASAGISRAEYEESKALRESAAASWREASERLRQSREKLDALKAQNTDSASVSEQFYNADIASIEAQIRAAEAQCLQLEDSIRKCSITADRAGTVSALPVRERSFISAGESLLTLRADGQPVVEADVLTSVSPYLSVGSPVEVQLVLRGKDASFSGSIKELYRYASRGVSALGTAEYRVHVKIGLTPESAEALRDKDGYGVTVTLHPYSNPDALTVPSDAVFSEGEQDYVYMISAGKAYRQPVSVAYRTVSDCVISAGLSEGEEVIIHADSKGIWDGIRVRK